MREIKFRAWHHDLKVMLYPPSPVSSSFNAEPITMVVSPEHESFLERDFNGNPWIIPEEKFPFQAEMTWDGRIYIRGKLQNVDLMQWTGLVDISGRDIYIGDLVQYNNNCLYDGINFVVKEKSTLGFYIENATDELVDGPTVLKDGKLSTRYLRLEVIGNIFENPELLG
jgi:uncharacterized phage protein (TIGR01671 family)